MVDGDITMGTLYHLAEQYRKQLLSSEASNPFLETMSIERIIQQEPPIQRFLSEKYLPIPKGMISTIVAAGGTGKSTLIMQASAALASGRDGDSEDGQCVIIFYGEDSHDMIWRRFHDLAKKENYSSREIKALSKNLKLVSLYGHSAYLTQRNKHETEETGVVTQVLEAVNIHQPVLLVIDPISAFKGGSENDNDDARRFANVAAKISEMCGCAILLVHHTGKQQDGSQNDARGASALVDATRCLYKLEKASASVLKDNNISNEYFGRIVKLTMPKANYMRTGNTSFFLQDEEGFFELINNLKKVSTFLAASTGNKIIDIVRQEIKQGNYHTKSGFTKKFSGATQSLQLNEHAMRNLLDELINQGKIDNCKLEGKGHPVLMLPDNV